MRGEYLSPTLCGRMPQDQEEIDNEYWWTE